MNVLEMLGIKRPAVLNQYQSPVMKPTVVNQSPVTKAPTTTNVVPLVPPPQVLPEATKTTLGMDNKTLGQMLLGFGKGLLSKGQMDSPWSAGILGAADGYAAGVANSEEAVVRSELEAAYKSGDQGKIALARSKYQALPNYNKDVLAGLEAARNESITGIKQETGYVYNPTTGKTEYIDPNGDLDYQANKATAMAQVNTDAAVNQFKELSPLELDAKLKLAKGMGDYDFEQWKTKNKTEYEQQLEVQKQSLETQFVRQDKATELADTKAQQRAADPLYTEAVESIANIDAGIIANTEAMQLAADLPSNLVQTVSNFVSPVIGSEYYDKVQAYRSVIGKAALALHTEGVMTDKDYERYVEMAGNPRTSPAALQQLITANIDRSKAIRAQMVAQRDKYGSVLGYSAPTQSTTTTTSDSGGNTSVSGSSW